MGQLRVRGSEVPEGEAHAPPRRQEVAGEGRRQVLGHPVGQAVGQHPHPLEEGRGPVELVEQPDHAVAELLTVILGPG